MRRVVSTVCLALTTALGAACGFGDYTVVRVQNGRAREGRYIPSEAYAASLEASLAAERGDWATALAALRIAFGADPEAADLQARIGTALCHLGKPGDAMRAYQSALESDPALERAYTERAACRLLQKPPDVASARTDLAAAIVSDPEALEPALLLIDLDLRDGKLVAARARAEEAAVLHPTSASAWRTLAEVAAKQSDAPRTVEAALKAGALDADQGKAARASAEPVADLAGVAAYSLAMRGTHAPPPTSAPSTVDASCAARIHALESIASHAGADAVTLAADAVRAACPRFDAEATMIEVQATWSPLTAEDVESRASSAPSASARRWASRMRLRRVALSELLGPDGLPPAQDRETLALHVAAAAVRRAGISANDPLVMALAKTARDLAPAEPTVARLAAEAARRAGKPWGDPSRLAACALARTEVEKAACKVP